MKPAKPLQYFKSRAALRRYVRTVQGLREPAAGTYGDCKVWDGRIVKADDSGGLASTLGWFAPALEASPLFMKLPISMPHLFGPAKEMWMSWHPMEVLSILWDSRVFKGGRRVLVCGLGLGVMQQLLEGLYGEVVTLEKNALMGPPLFNELKRDNWRLVVGDAYHAHRVFRRGAFDAVYFDIWENFPSEDGWDKAHELCRAIGREILGAPLVRCWAEDLVGLHPGQGSGLRDVLAGANVCAKIDVPDWV